MKDKTVEVNKEDSKNEIPEIYENPSGGPYIRRVEGGGEEAGTILPIEKFVETTLEDIVSEEVRTVRHDLGFALDVFGRYRKVGAANDNWNMMQNQEIITAGGVVGAVWVYDIRSDEIDLYFFLEVGTYSVDVELYFIQFGFDYGKGLS